METKNENPKTLIPILICSTPKTVVCVDSSLSEAERQKRINHYLDRKGQLKIDTVSEYSVYD